jgi:glycosyltransferase involved in cell wall biosynthesis
LSFFGRIVQRGLKVVHIEGLGGRRDMRTIVHLLASTFVGGPERQLLGLARNLPEDHRTLFYSFSEKGRCRGLIRQAVQEGLEAQSLHADTPWFGAAIHEIAQQLEECQGDVLCCHGYKANLLGRLAARRVGVPVVAVSRGWTGESLKVRFYEGLDRYCLRWMDRVVCVSEAQAEKVLRAGVKTDRVRVIANAVDMDRFSNPDDRFRAKLARYFRQPRTRIIGAAGRLSPEKGFDVLLAAAETVLQRDPTVGFIIFGEGPCRQALLRQINAAGLTGQVVLAGFRADLERFLPYFDLLALPSHTEGLPNVVLEAFAAGVPVAATAVGGTPEVVEDGVSGYLVPPGDSLALADRISDALRAGDQLQAMGAKGRLRVREEFSFATQCEQYTALFDELCPQSEVADTPASAEKPTPSPTVPACTR